MQSSAPLATAAAAGSTSTTASTGFVGTVRNMVQFGGLRTLYTGITLPLAAQAVYKGTVFTVNNLTETAIKEWQTQENYKLGHFVPYQLTLWDRFLSGFMGGAVNAAFFCTPVEYVRNQQIALIGTSMSPPSSSKAASTTPTVKDRRPPPLKSTTGPISVIQRTVNTNGILGLWRGMASTVLRDSVGCGLFFVSMAYAQERLTAPYSSSVTQAQPSTSTIMLSGAIAGVAFWVWALPVDTLKTWIQSGTASNLTHAVQMSQRNGLIGSIPSLFRGWQVAYTRGAPSAAITVLTYSSVLQHLQHQQQQQLGTHLPSMSED
jgi:hypothetical protein